MAEVARSFLLLSRKLARESSELRHPDWNSDLTLTEQSVPGRGSSAAGARSCRGRLQVVRRGPWADSLRGRGVAAAASPGASWIRGVELLAGTKRAFGSRRSQRGVRLCREAGDGGVDLWFGEVGESGLRSG